MSKVQNTLDKGVGGYASGATSGLTDIVREKIYGGGINDNQHGALHDFASGLGDLSSSIVGGAAAKGGSRLVKAGAGLLRNANKAADTYRKGESAYDIARGCGTLDDVRNLAGGLADRSGKHEGGNGHPPVMGIKGTGGTPENLNWSPKSDKTFGHTFKTHGSGTKNTKKLSGRAAGTGQEQGQWINNRDAAEYLKSRSSELSGPASIRIPKGLGQVIKPDGSVVPAKWATVVPKPGGGYRSGYPISSN